MLTKSVDHVVDSRRQLPFENTAQEDTLHEHTLHEHTPHEHTPHEPTVADNNPHEHRPHEGADHFTGHHYEMPLALFFVRETPEFTVKTVPTGLLKSHSLAAHLWGRLTVHKGTVRFTFEEPEVFDIELQADQHVDIPPLIHHHVVPFPGGSFSVSFFRKPPGE
jgi:tellurite resistance-related uncharacterized protein